MPGETSVSREASRHRLREGTGTAETVNVSPSMACGAIPGRAMLGIKA